LYWILVAVRAVSLKEIIHVVQRSNSGLDLSKTVQAHREEIVLATTVNFDNLRRHSDEECRTY
jgi:hypothetical protein